MDKQKLIEQFDWSRVAFITTAIGTRWLWYQQCLIKTHFPKSHRLIVDGNRKWDWSLGIDCTWYSFIRVILANRDKYDYFVHIDEDCFLTSGEGIKESFTKIHNEGFDLIGPQDAFTMFRIANHRALNSFLLIGKIESLSRVWKDFDQELTFDQIGLSIDPKTKKVDIELEPYYTFFWNFYQQEMKIGFIDTGYSMEFECTTLINENRGVYGYHMWYTRRWYSKQSIITKSNRDRYLDMGTHLHSLLGLKYRDMIRSVDLKRYSALMYSRFVIKSILRLTRKLNHLLNG